MLIALINLWKSIFEQSAFGNNENQFKKRTPFFIKKQTEQYPKQICIFTGPPRNIEEFLPILNRKDNIYLRYQDTGQNHHFVTTKQPVFNGITIEYGEDRLFFTKIRILSDLRLRLIKKILLQYQENDWTPLFGQELFLLKDPIPQYLHSILRHSIE